jgi:hypothetical protein
MITADSKAEAEYFQRMGLSEGQDYVLASNPTSSQHREMLSDRIENADTPTESRTSQNSQQSAFQRAADGFRALDRKLQRGDEGRVLDTELNRVYLRQMDSLLDKMERAQSSGG